MDENQRIWSRLGSLMSQIEVPAHLWLPAMDLKPRSKYFALAISGFFSVLGLFGKNFGLLLEDGISNEARRVPRSRNGLGRRKIVSGVRGITQTTPYVSSAC